MNAPLSRSSVHGTRTPMKLGSWLLLPLLIVVAGLLVPAAAQVGQDTRNQVPVAGQQRLPMTPGAGQQGLPMTRGEGQQGLPMTRGEGQQGLPMTRGEGQQQQLTPKQVQEAPKPSDFQRFVERSTGRLLPIFGHNFFSEAGSFAPVTNISPPASYVLGPGDSIQVNVWGGFEMVLELSLDARGLVSIPRVGSIPLAGVSVGELESVLRGHLEKVFKNVELAATLSRLRSIEVFLVGQARRPGTYTLSGLSTVITALFSTGGPSPGGSMRKIELRRGGRLVSTIDLYQFLTAGIQNADVTLQSGDAIVIPPVGPQVAVGGMTDYAAIYELVDGDRTLQDILAYGGGTPKLASRARAVLERINPAKDVPRFVKDIALNGDGLGTPLQDGDVVTLLPISPAFENAVSLKGAVSQPVRMQWRSGMRLRDLIPDRGVLLPPDFAARKNAEIDMTGSVLTGRINPDRVKDTTSLPNRLGINFDYAYIERIDPKDFRSKLIPFNLGKLLAGDSSQNILLHAGDSVTILSDADLKIPQAKRSRLVTVEGEVNRPGVFNIRDGETLPELLWRVGGLTDNAYLFGAVFSRESAREQQQANLDRLIAQLESAMTAGTAASAANLGLDASAADAAAAAAAAKAAGERQLASLRALRSSGRVALELEIDTELSRLPPIAVEDGDRIFVPTRPSFLAAFGAVRNQNALVYRSGRTVGDVLALAGVTDDANTEQMFILRADGTIKARGDATFLNRFENITLYPGDTVVVPYLSDRQTGWTKFVRGLNDWTKILSNLGLGLAALKQLQTP